MSVEGVCQFLKNNFERFEAIFSFLEGFCLNFRHISRILSRDTSKILLKSQKLISLEKQAENITSYNVTNFKVFKVIFPEIDVFKVT